MKKTEDYHSLAVSGDVLIAETGIIYSLLKFRRISLVAELYKHIYAPPSVYAACQKNLDIESLKTFNAYISQMDYQPSKIALDSILDQSGILTEDDGYNILCAMVKKIDVILDDPRKERKFLSHSIHTLRISDILVSAALTKK